MQVRNEESPINGQHDGRRLREILKKLNLSVHEFAERPFLDKSRPAAYVLLRKAKFSREELALVCYLFNLEVTEFDYPYDYLWTPFNKNRLQERHNSVAAFHALAAYSEQEDTGANKFLKEYFIDLARFASQATKQLRIYHYLGKPPHQIKKFVLKQYETYYSQLEETLRLQPQLRYERFAALPIQVVDGVNTYSNIEEKVIELLPLQTIRHISYCLKQFGDQFSFFAVGIPSRLNSFTLVDDKYVISEYDRLNRHKKASHDLMFVDRITQSIQSDPITGLWQVYSNDLDNLVREPDSSARRAISLERLLEVSFSKLNQLEKEVKELESKLELSRNSLQLGLFERQSLDSISEMARLKEKVEEIKPVRSDWEAKFLEIRNCLKPL